MCKGVFDLVYETEIDIHRWIGGGRWIGVALASLLMPAARPADRGMIPPPRKFMVAIWLIDF